MRRSLKALSKPLGVESYIEKQSTGIARTTKIFMDRGMGSELFDKEGKRYLDFTCGIGVTNLGHCHPQLVKTVQTQAGRLWHGQVTSGVTTALAGLIDEMTTVLPASLTNMLFVNSGAEAVETAMRAAKQFTKRSCVIAMQGSYHGRTTGSLSLTSSKASYGAGCRPLQAGVHFAPIPYPSQLHVPNNTDVTSMTQQCLARLDDILTQQVSASEVAMIIVEPVMGEGGYVPLPTPFLRGLRERCDKHGIVLVFDEVQCGFGRCGTFFTTSPMGITPDMLIFGKGIANGLPLAGVAMTSAVASASAPGTHGGTYAGNAIPTAVGAEVVRILRDTGVLANCIERGTQLWTGLEELILRRGLPVCEVRGRGLMIGLQFAGVPVGSASAVVQEAYRRGLLLLTTSSYEALRIIPPLTVTAEEVQESLGIIEESMVAALSNPAAATRLEFRSCCNTPCTGSVACRRYVTPAKPL